MEDPGPKDDKGGSKWGGLSSMLGGGATKVELPEEPKQRVDSVEAVSVVLPPPKPLCRCLVTKKKALEAITVAAGQAKSNH